ncbi:MAG: hypothetical protein HN337_07300 [Deltaproteobacteria bacterium]|nr:hypothetical protein [Deltaproteobacteria bacterium]
MIAPNQAKPNSLNFDKAREDLAQIENEIRKADPDQTDIPYFVGRRLSAITNNQDLLSAAGVTTAMEYMEQTMERIGLLKSTAYNYRSYYRMYQKHKSAIKAYCGEEDIRQGYLAKVLLLDKAIAKRCTGTDGDTMEEVIQHLVNDSYREFKYYATPELEREDTWKRKLKVWMKKIRASAKLGLQIHLIVYTPSEIYTEEFFSQTILDVAGGTEHNV